MPHPTASARRYARPPTTPLTRRVPGPDLDRWTPDRVLGRWCPLVATLAAAEGVTR